ncbi:MAG: cell division protein ZapA [Oscillospiraceae bacterium]|nr:cell division protein ZapA [Oscillospiraceae bacterium]
MNKFKVTICGREFPLQTDEQPEYYIKLADKVESTISSMSRGTDSLNVFSAALLTALSAFDEAKKANDSIDNIRTQIKEYVDDACQSRIERDEAVKRAEVLSARVAALENELNILKMREDISGQLTLENKNKN